LADLDEVEQPLVPTRNKRHFPSVDIGFETVRSWVRDVANVEAEKQGLVYERQLSNVEEGIGRFHSVEKVVAVLHGHVIGLRNMNFFTHVR
jgi:hypothetical protein